MSISTIRTIATSALMASQVRMQVTSSNIANADTEGYTRKTASQTATVTGGTNSGTTVSAMSGTVDKYLLRDLVAATSDQSAADCHRKLYQFPAGPVRLGCGRRRQRHFAGRHLYRSGIRLDLAVRNAGKRHSLQCGARQPRHAGGATARDIEPGAGTATGR